MNKFIWKSFRAFVRGQSALSGWFDRTLPGDLSVNPFLDFNDCLARPLLNPGAVVYDVGGGRRPLLNIAEKQHLQLRLYGVDIDEMELAGAPAGLYDRAICADITSFRGEGDGDLVICRTVLEHVADAGKGLAGIASLLRPGGMAAIFVPCRNALFARLNLVFPQRLKRALLNALWPEDRGSTGFPARYHECTPAAMIRAASRSGLEVTVFKPYFTSYYFYFLFPLHLAWRAMAGVMHRLLGNEAAEYFALIVRKTEAAAAPEHAAVGRDAAQAAS